MDGSHQDVGSVEQSPERVPREPSLRWRVFGASVIGHSHISRGIGNQDAVHWYPADDGLDKTGLPAIIAVSDGHGESACVRSDIGARFAVEIAVDVLREFSSDLQFRGGNSAADVREFAPRLLERQLTERWKARVLAHSGRHPFSPRELLRLTGVDELPPHGLITKKKLKAYGCTVLAALATPSLLVALQVGDGAIVVAYPNGESRLLIPPHEAHFGNETTSLCSDPVEMAVVVHALDTASPVVVMACTDGYEKAIDTDYFRNTLLGEYVEVFRKRHGWREIYKELPSMLEDATSKGSGDDTTVAFMVSSLLEDMGILTTETPITGKVSADKTYDPMATDSGQIQAKSQEGNQHSLEEHVQSLHGDPPQ